MSREKSELKELVLNLIPSNKYNAITLADLSSFTGYPYRTLKEIITELRKSYPICSKETDGGGYWIAENEEDIVEFVKMIERRKSGYQRTIDTMKTHLSDKTYYNLQGGNI